MNDPARPAPPGTAIRARYWCLVAVVALLCALVLPALPAASPVAAASPDLVISQVYGGGGNTGAPYNSDFIEIFNRGATAVSLASRSLQYASATGTGNFGANAGQLTTLPAVTLQPGQYYLVQESSGTTGAALPTPDLAAANPINLSGSAGKVALVTDATSLGCNGGSTPCSAAQLARIIDLVGYGNANFAEGSPAPTLGNTTAARRASGGCADTDNNAADFTAPAPAPRTTASPLAPCGTTPTPTPTPAPDATRIHDIQGAAHLSPLVGTAVANVPGVVTGLRSNGFYLQDPNPDPDDRTSEGIFVFTSSAPTVAVGDDLLVGGTVSEFRPGGTAASNASLTITEIAAPSIAVVASGTPLPAVTVIGAGGRVPPTTVIEDDTNGSVETNNTFDPAQDGLDFYESLEGMHVRVNNAVAVGPTSDFGSNREIPVIPDGGTGAGLRTPRGGIIIRPGDFNPERLILNDLVTGVDLLPLVNVGDGLGDVTGVIDYNFSNYKLEVTALPARTDNHLPRETTTVTHTAGGLTIATFNVENLDPGDGPAKFANLAAEIVANLGSPDIVALEEIQDNNGATDNGVVDANLTFEQLIAAIVAAGGPTYQFRQINPVDDQDGGEPGGNIRVGFLFNPASGVAFVDRPGGCPTCAVGVTGSGPATQLTTSPGRIAPTNPAFTASRKPLAGEFTVNGRTLFVIANHFNSKGGDDPLFGRYQPPTLSSETQRLQQARIVHDFVQQLLAADPNANVVVLGDINDFQFSAVAGVLTAGGVLTSLITTLPAHEQYSYVFEGNAQTLDQILVSPTLIAQFRNGGPGAYDVVHVNAEYADQISDHDPQVARFSLVTPAPTAGDLAATTPEDTNVAITLVGTAATGGPLTYTIVTQPQHGTLGPVSGNQATYTPAADFNGTDTFTYRANDGTADSNVATVTITVTPVNDAPTVAVVDNAGRCGDAGGTFVLALADPDSAPAALTLTATSSDLALVPAGGLALGGTGTARTLAITPTSKRDGTATVTVTASDGQASTTLTITVIAGDNGADTLVGTAGADLILGGNGTDTLDGRGGPDLLCGGNGDDTLSGGDGDDSLDEGNGADYVSGGNGVDTAVDFTPAAGDTSDGTLP